MFRKLAALGLSHEQMAGVLEIFEADAETRKAKVRDRVQRWRDKQPVTSRNVTKHAETLHEGSRGGARVEDNLLTKNQAGQKERKQENAPAALREFDAFWSLYPNKVGKREVEKAFVKALSRASFDTIMAGLQRYVAKTDDRPWCNPTTFLNQNRWEDQPAVPQRTATGPPPQDDFNTILDGYINGSRYDENSQPANRVDAGNGGPDRRSAQGAIQQHGLQTRR